MACTVARTCGQYRSGDVFSQVSAMQANTTSADGKGPDGGENPAPAQSPCWSSGFADRFTHPSEWPLTWSDFLER
jgi:hypothetical protein